MRIAVVHPALVVQLNFVHVPNSVPEVHDRRHVSTVPQDAQADSGTTVYFTQFVRTSNMRGALGQGNRVINW